MQRRPTAHRTGISGAVKVNYVDVWRVFECSNPRCDYLMKTLERDLDAGLAAKCPKCGHDTPPATMSRAGRWKYCRVCGWLQPLEAFHRHARQASGRQLECINCKNTKINPALNPLRTADQLRESAEGRRLLVTIARDSKIDEHRVRQVFGNKCFNCGLALSADEGQLDHTLPIKLFWPLQDNATLLCDDCNGQKAERWPTEFYKSGKKLRELAVKSGVPFALLTGPPMLNPKAIDHLQRNFDDFIVRWAKYPRLVKRVVKLVREMTNIDLLEDREVPKWLR